MKDARFMTYGKEGSGSTAADLPAVGRRIEVDMFGLGWVVAYVAAPPPTTKLALVQMYATLEARGWIHAAPKGCDGAAAWFDPEHWREIN